MISHGSLGGIVLNVLYTYTALGRGSEQLDEGTARGRARLHRGSPGAPLASRRLLVPGSLALAAFELALELVLVIDQPGQRRPFRAADLPAHNPR